MNTEQTTIINTLRDLGSYQKYADYQEIIDSLKSLGNESISVLALFIDTIQFDFQQDGQPTKYSGVMEYCINQVYDDINLINQAYRNDENITDATDFYATKQYGAILHTLASLNEEVEGEVILNTTYADEFSAYTYQDLADELESGWS